jgi:hypothetical protein
MRSALKLKALKRKATKTTKARSRASSTPEAPIRQQTLVMVDALLDEALDETFPASDPVALTQPSLRRRAALRAPAGQSGPLRRGRTGA